MAQLHISGRARLQVDAIYDYLLNEAGERIAENMVQQFRDAFTILAEMPYAGKLCKIAPSLREWPVRPYRVFYQATPKRVDIVAVFHQRRDIRPDMLP